MEEFKGMSRDTRRTKTPANMWEFARNILLTKGFTSVTNEEGFDYIHDVPGNVIGVINTNEEVVYFSVDNNFSYIGYFKTNEPALGYIPVLQSIYLGFKINRPIEGIFYYNFKGELIVGFCDGVFEDSNTPKLINLTNIGIELDINYELVNPNDIGQLNLYTISLEGEIDTDYTSTGTLEVDIAYVTFAYVLEDGQSNSSFFPAHEITYPKHNFRKKDKRNIILNFTKLDTKYTKLIIGLVVINEEGLIGYKSNIVDYVGDTYSTVISSLNNFSESTVDELIVPSEVYTRIKTMTTINNEVVIGNLVKSNNIKLQKYINNIELSLNYDIRKPSKFNHPILCPDEVYSFTIAGQLLDGTYTEEFHVPGPNKRFVEETDVLTLSDLTALGLDYLNTLGTFKRFQIFNRGGFKINTIPININNPSELELHWGFWQNEETYPINDEYNGTEDYEGNSITGQDLRGLPIRYHRIPGLDALVEKFPCLLGYTNKNAPELINNNGKLEGLVPSFSVTVLNFEEVIPLEIREKLQGYKLSIVKRKSGERLVEDINFLKQTAELEMEVPGGTEFFDFMICEKPSVDGNHHRFAANQYGISRIISNTLGIFKPNISALLVKANYGIIERFNNSSTNSDGIPETDVTLEAKKGNIGGINWIVSNSFSLPDYIKIPNTQRFAVIKEIEYIPGNSIPNKTLLIEDFVKLKADNSLQPANSDGSLPQLPNRWNPLLITGTINNTNVTVLGYESATGTYKTKDLESDNCYRYFVSSTFINLVKNVYSGFNPKEFITIGTSAKSSNPEVYVKEFKNCGDVFTNNIYNVPTTIGRGSSLQGRVKYCQLYIRGGIAIPNNSEQYIIKDRKYGRVYDISGTASELDELLTYKYIIDLYNKDVFRSLNDLIVSLAFSINSVFINYFPFRVHRSLTIKNENIQTNNIRTFLSNSYKEMLNDRGEIIALRGTKKTLYIQQKYSLFIASIKDTLNTNGTTTFLGENDLFSREPDEVGYGSNKGNIGCTSQFACIIYDEGFVTIDQVKGIITIINNNNQITASDANMNDWFERKWNISENYYTLNRFGNKQKVDNPFNSVGHLVGYDYKYNRLLFTKKEYIPLFELDEDYTFDGEFYYLEGERLDYNNINLFKNISQTFSFNLGNKAEDNVFVCNHDYYPNYYFNTNRGLYAGRNKNFIGETYKCNSKLKKGTYFTNTKYESYIDLVFNQRFDISKLYQAVEWNTEVIDEATNSKKYFKTIDAIMLYTDFQNSGIINIPDNTFAISRNIENKWQLNQFRDMTNDRNFPVVGEDGAVLNNVNINKSWFDKSNFINNFIVIRMIMKNLNNDAVYINCVNVKSRISNR